MGVPRFRVRQWISEEMGDWRPIALTNGSTTTAVGEEIRDYAEDDDAFPRWHATVTELAGTTHSFADRVILREGGYDYSADRLTVGRSFGGTVASGDVLELHRYDPNLMHIGIERAIDFIHDRGIFLPVEHVFVIDNLLHNSSFEDWVSATEVAGWADTGSTQAQNGDRIVEGLYSLQVTADSGGDTITQNLFAITSVKSTTAINLAAGITAAQTDIPVDNGLLFSVGDKIIAQSERMRVLGVEPDTIYVERGVDGTSTATHADNILISFVRPSLNVKELVGKTLRFEGWVWASAASAARLRVTFDGSSYTSGSYHGGSDQWEGPGTMYVSAQVPADATEIKVVCDIAASQTAYFDNMSAYVNSVPVRRYPIPSKFEGMPRQVRIADSRQAVNPDYNNIGVNNTASSGHRVKLLGKGRITKPTGETSIIEVSDEIGRALATKAAAFTFEMHGSGLSDIERERAYDSAQVLHNRFEDMIMGKANNVSQSMPSGWRVERGGEQNVLVLD
jgi:hypothetical protein